MYLAYEGTPKEADVREHGPDNGGKIRNVEQSRSVPLHEERNDGVAEEVKDHKANIVKDYSGCVTWGRIRKRSILLENNE